MRNENLYAAPKSDLNEGVPVSCQRMGKLVFVPVNHDFPERCIICNAPSKQPTKQRKMHWHSPWLFLLFLLSIPIYVIVALLVRKSMQVSPGYCDMHAKKRRRSMSIFLIPAMVLMLGSLALGMSNSGPVYVFAFCVGFLLLIPGAIASKTVTPKRIDQNGATFMGCKEPFLSSLPVGRK